MIKEKVKILIVDDEKSIITLLSSILGEQGYMVETAQSSEEALVKLGNIPQIS